jgi:hypothetical protein
MNPYTDKFFKRRRIPPAVEYTKKSEFPTQEILNKSFVCADNQNTNLFKCELAIHLTESICLILRCQRQQLKLCSDAQHEKQQKPKIKSNSGENKDKDNIYVIAFNLLHAIMNNLHMSRAKLRHIESDLLGRCTWFVTYTE